MIRIRVFLTGVISSGLLFVSGCEEESKESVLFPMDTPPIATGDAPPQEAAETISAPLSNLRQLLQSTNADNWHQAGAHCENQRIAIFDNGFLGLTDSLGKRLPPDLKVNKAPANAELQTAHGTKLAELIWAICSGSASYSPDLKGPQLKLFNTNGFTNLTAGAEEPVDIVLYSQVWEFGGNFDGKGFINALVNKVTSSPHKTLWVNASGNFGQSVWQGGVTFDHQKQVKLPFKDKYVRISVNSPETPVKLTLAWNDFTDSKDHRTRQDLDFFLEDGNQRVIASSTLKQDGDEHAGQEGYSAYAREQMTTVLGAGIYLIRVISNHPENFNGNSRLRIAGDGAGVVFLDQTKEASVMIPADNPEVLTVGASDVDYSSSGIIQDSERRKPEALAPSIIEFGGDKTFAGSSSAAALSTALIGLYHSKCGVLTRQQWADKFQAGLMGTSSKARPRDKTPIFSLPEFGQCL